MQHDFEYRAALDLLPLARAIVNGPRMTRDALDTAERVVSRWKWVEVAELGMQSYATLHFETARADVAARRMAETLAKVDRLIAHYEDAG